MRNCVRFASASMCLSHVLCTYLNVYVLYTAVFSEWLYYAHPKSYVLIYIHYGHFMYVGKNGNDVNKRCQFKMLSIITSNKTSQTKGPKCHTGHFEIHPIEWNLSNLRQHPFEICYLSLARNDSCIVEGGGSTRNQQVDQNKDHVEPHLVEFRCVISEEIVRKDGHKYSIVLLRSKIQLMTWISYLDANVNTGRN